MIKIAGDGLWKSRAWITDLRVTKRMFRLPSRSGSSISFGSQSPLSAVPHSAYTLMLPMDMSWWQTWTWKVSPKAVHPCPVRFRNLRAIPRIYPNSHGSGKPDTWSLPLLKSFDRHGLKTHLPQPVWYFIMKLCKIQAYRFAQFINNLGRIFTLFTVEICFEKDVFTELPIKHGSLEITTSWFKKASRKDGRKDNFGFIKL